MKTFSSSLLFVFALLCGSTGLAQGADCANADPFCTENGAAFPASTNTEAESGPDYGCLWSQPNPAWYFFEIATSGDIDISLTNSAYVDVDFICWGPFANLGSACSNLTFGNIVDCSYDPQEFEEINIPNAVAGEFYMLLITNYSGDPTDIFADQIGGNGATDCSILTPCVITNFTVNLGACDGAGNYAATGSFVYNDNPGSGSVIVEVDNGTTTYTQTFNPPFTNGQTYNFNIPNIPGDGAASTITVYFTADNGCMQEIDYIAPNCVSSCYFDWISAEIGACEEDYTYTVTGEFSYDGNPGSGTLIVEVDNGTDVYTQVFNPPFVDGQLYNFSISGIPTNGATSTITAYFSDDPSCTVSLDPYEAPNCGCQADIGTFTESITDDPVVLCYGDQYTVTPNGDMVPPEEAFDPPGPTYDPGIGWLVYSCPPTIGVTPSPTEDPVNDPCLVSQINGEIAIVYLDDLPEINDQYWIDTYPGVFTDNIVYFVPITIYSVTDGYYNYTNTPMPCYDLGDPFAVQYLPEVESDFDEDCSAGTVTATFSGGLPAIDGSSFTVVPGTLTPASANFVNTSCGNGGNIVLENVNVGDNYSFEVTDPNGCTVTISGTMDGSGNATMTYPDTDYCIDEADPTPAIVGLQGGTYTSTAGLSLNATTGTIDLSASTPATYTITYTGPGALCPPVSTFTLTIHALPVVNAGPDQNVCEGGQVTLTATGAATYNWDNGVTNGVAFYPAATQTYTVTGESAAGCEATDQVTVTVLPEPQPVFIADVTQGCSPLEVTFTNQSGGNNCTWDFGDGTTATGCGSVTHTFYGVGCYDITLTVEQAAGCVGTNTQANMVCVSPDPVASFTPVPNILTLTDPVSQMVNNSTNATSYHWNFGDGTESTATAPLHTFPDDEAGSYSIQLIAYSAFGCTDTAYATVIINEDLIFYVPNAFTPDNDEFNQGFVPVFTSGFDPYNFNMLIFDRWGEIIFESNNSGAGWDGTYQGKPVKEGVYTWKIEFKRSENDANQIAIGHVSLLR